MSHDQSEFAEFFQASWEPCLRAVVASTGSVSLAEDQVAEAFARAWLSWRKVRRHPAPRLSWPARPSPAPASPITGRILTTGPPGRSAPRSLARPAMVPAGPDA